MASAHLYLRATNNNNSKLFYLSISEIWNEASPKLVFQAKALCVIELICNAAFEMK